MRPIRRQNFLQDKLEDYRIEFDEQELTNFTKMISLSFGHFMTVGIVKQTRRPSDKLWYLFTLSLAHQIQFIHIPICLEESSD